MENWNGGSYGVYSPRFNPCGNFQNFKFRDIHDNLKENTLSNSVLASAQSSATGELAGVSNSTGNLMASDEANISNSGNVATTNNFVDPGSIAAAQQIAQSALYGNTQATQAAASTLQYAMELQTHLAQTTDQGQVNALAKTLGVVAAAIAGIWVVGKILVAVFTGKKREAEA